MTFIIEKITEINSYLINSAMWRQIVDALKSCQLFSLLFRIMMINISTFEFASLLEETRLSSCGKSIFIRVRRRDAVFACISSQRHVLLLEMGLKKAGNINWK